jgi:hypothetical protein
MASLLEVLLHPESRRPDPAPSELDVFRVIAIGTSAWTVGLIVGGLLYVAGISSWQVPAACATGVALGGIWWLHERRRARRNTGDATASNPPDARSDC